MKITQLDTCGVSINSIARRWNTRYSVNFNENKRYTTFGWELLSTRTVDVFTSNETSVEKLNVLSIPVVRLVRNLLNVFGSILFAYITDLFHYARSRRRERGFEITVTRNSLFVMISNFQTGRPYDKEISFAGAYFCPSNNALGISFAYVSRATLFEPRVDAIFPIQTAIQSCHHYYNTRAVTLVRRPTVGETVA